MTGQHSSERMVQNILLGADSIVNLILAEMQAD